MPYDRLWNILVSDNLSSPSKIQRVESNDTSSYIKGFMRKEIELHSLDLKCGPCKSRSRPCQLSLRSALKLTGDNAEITELILQARTRMPQVLGLLGEGVGAVHLVEKVELRYTTTVIMCDQSVGSSSYRILCMHSYVHTSMHDHASIHPYMHAHQYNYNYCTIAITMALHYIACITSNYRHYIQTLHI